MRWQRGLGEAPRPYWENICCYFCILYISTYINLNCEDFDLKLDNIVHTHTQQGMNAARAHLVGRWRHHHRVHSIRSVPHELTEDCVGAKVEQKKKTRNCVSHKMQTFAWLHQKRANVFLLMRTCMRMITGSSAAVRWQSQIFTIWRQW